MQPQTKENPAKEQVACVFTFNHKRRTIEIITQGGGHRQTVDQDSRRGSGSRAPMSGLSIPYSTYPLSLS